MGLSFSNFQLYCEGNINQKEITKMFIDLMSSLGFEITKDTELINRTIKLEFSPNNPWIGIYDSFSDNMSSKELKSMTDFISNAFSQSTIGINVFDSDILSIYLNNPQLKRKDMVICSNNNCSSEKIGYNSNTTKWKIKSWLSLLKNEEDKVKLEKAFKGQYDFAEDRLFDIADILSINKRSIYLGCVGPYEQNVDSHDLDGLKTLNFSYKKGFIPPFELVKKGLPFLSSYITTPISTNEVNNVIYYNSGGISKGVRFVIEGEVLKKHEFNFSEIEILRRKDYTKELYEMNGNQTFSNAENRKAFFVKKETKDGNIYYVAEFEDFTLPEGVKINIDYGSKGPWKKIYDSIRERSVYVKFSVKCESNIMKKEKLKLILIPFENPEEGKCVQENYFF